MRHRSLSFAAVALLLALCGEVIAAEPAPAPDEVELRQIADPALRQKLARLADSVALMVNEDDLREYNWQTNDGKDSVFRLTPYSHAGYASDGKRLCTKADLAHEPDLKEPGFNQSPSFGTCTAFKIADEYVMTAAHCVTACSSSYVVFGLHADDEGRLSYDAIPKKRVYRCISISDAALLGDYSTDVYWPSLQDWAMLQIAEMDPSIPNLRMNLDPARIKPKDTLVMLSHPNGAAMRVARNGAALETAELTFVTNLRSFHGSSGAPVFRLADVAKGDAVVSGVNFSGDSDYVEVASPAGGTCQAIKHCDKALDPKCAGGKVNQTSAIIKKLPLAVRSLSERKP